MSRRLIAIAVSACVTVATVGLSCEHASAALPTAPPLAPPASSAGAWFAGGFIGFVGLLNLYDIFRRTSCSGDFLGFGGPGFTSPITPAMSIISPPKCAKARQLKQ